MSDSQSLKLSLVPVKMEDLKFPHYTSIFHGLSHLGIEMYRSNIFRIILNHINKYKHTSSHHLTIDAVNSCLESLIFQVVIHPFPSFQLEIKVDLVNSKDMDWNFIEVFPEFSMHLQFQVNILSGGKSRKFFFFSRDQFQWERDN